MSHPEELNMVVRIAKRKELTTVVITASSVVKLITKGVIVLRRRQTRTDRCWGTSIRSENRVPTL